jgi:uncharacterized protein YdhG (YjbR/CyaY superfamily)
MPAATTKSPEVDAYLAKLPAPQRRALEQLRRVVRSVAPKATEVISYGVPMFKQDGGLVAYAGGTRHCSLYLMSLALSKKLSRELEPWLSGKTTLHFTPDAPLPAPLVKRVVKARLAENVARQARRRRTP